MKNIQEAHALSVEECLRRAKTTINGLTKNEANIRLEENGKNKLNEAKKKNKFLTLLGQFTDLMIIILLIAATISITLAIIEGEPSELVDGFVILAIVLVNGLLGFFQEQKAEKSLEALKQMTVKECKVIRDGEVIKVFSEDIVVGDIVVLEAGDIVPADLRLIETAHLKCDEASLTGESHSIEKCVDKLEAKTVLGDRKNMLFSGTVVVYGRGLGVVVETGVNTQIGKIAEMLNAEQKTLTPLQENMKSLGKIVTFIVIGVAVVVFFLELFERQGATVMNAFLTAVAVAVAAIPESMPAVVTIIMALGVSRLAKRKAIVKKLNAVETLGCCEVICSDKTGTLTENRMVVKAAYYNKKLYEEEKYDKSIEFDILLRTMVLCNDSTPKKDGFLGDPTETALCTYAINLGVNKSQFDKTYKRIDEIPFDSNRKRMTTYNLVGKEAHTYTKGGLDEILSICTRILINGEVKELTNEIKDEIKEKNQGLASKALRTLAFAYNTEKKDEEDLIFVGIIGMMDPPRKEVKAAVKDCLDAGITPIMITGDHKSTAFAVAKEIGIATNSKEVITGAELDKLSDKEFMEKLWTIKVYARVSPENKVRIVKAFRKQGKIVAMTGDGVNDAPSIKSANIGIGMGITGTDVSKDVSDIILADDNFATIVIAVEEGRKIYKNIEKTVKYLFSANMAELISVLITTIFFPSFVFLLPVQILFVNIITDSLPAIALGLEPPEQSLMNEKPRKQGQRLFDKINMRDMLICAVMQAGCVIGSYLIGLHFFSEAGATTMAFITLNFVQVIFLFSARIVGSAFKSNPFKNKWIIYSALFSLVMLMVLVLTPIRSIVHVEMISIAQWGIALGFSVLVFPLAEIYKYAKSKNFWLKSKKVVKNELEKVDINN